MIVGRRGMSDGASIAARIAVGGRRRRRLKFAVHPPNQRFVLVDKLFNRVPAFSSKRNLKIRWTKKKKKKRTEDDSQR